MQKEYTLSKEDLLYLKHHAKKNFKHYLPYGRNDYERYFSLLKGYISEFGFYMMFKDEIPALTKPNFTVNKDKPDDGGYDFCIGDIRIDVKSVEDHQQVRHICIPKSKRAQVYVLLEINADTGQTKYINGINLSDDRINKLNLPVRLNIFPEKYYAISEEELEKNNNFDISSYFIS